MLVMVKKRKEERKGGLQSMDNDRHTRECLADVESRIMMNYITID